MFIDGIALAGYRSFGPELQKIGPFKKINLLIGQNNSGKSNILLFLTKHYAKLIESIKTNRRVQGLNLELDIHNGMLSDRLAFGLPAPIGGSRYNEVIIKFPDDNWKQSALDSLKKILSIDSLVLGTRTAWLTYSAENIDGPLQFRTSVNAKDLLDNAEWDKLAQVLLGQNFVLSDDRSQGLATLLRYLSPAESMPPSIVLIPAIRKVEDPSNTTHAIIDDFDNPKYLDDLSGKLIIDKLAYLQNPPGEKQEYKKKFNQINHLLQEVTGNLSASLEIPYKRNMILVHMDQKTLPLAYCGTGIHEIIILAAAATVLDNQVICMEEPEIHMHPILQKKLMKYLDQNTNNQYIITTHSAHLLDTPNAAIFHVRLENGCSIVDPVESAPDKACICFDLGYRASDLMQSNCIIWVEGPSDRIYVNHWLKALDENLIEGIHYSIMFYGGQHLSHLDVDDTEIDDFISLRRLNRNLCVIMDSDKGSEENEIHDAKKLIMESFEKDSHGFAWVTKGREIENYIEGSVMKAAISSCHPRAIFDEKETTTQYRDWFDLRDSNGGKIKSKKFKVAKQVCEREREANLDVLDLKERMDQLIKFIYKANGMEEQPEGL